MTMKDLKLVKIISIISISALIPLLFTPVAIPFVFFGAVFGFLFASLLISMLKKFNLQKLLKYILYLAFVFMISLSIYHFVKTYTSYFSDFYGYRNFEQFIYYNPFKFLTFPSRFLWETFVLVIMADLFFIGIGTGFIVYVYLEISGLENKKER